MEMMDQGDGGSWSTERFCLTAVMVDNWNNDLSPWKASAVFGLNGVWLMATVAALASDILTLCLFKSVRV